ncbi:hypothetical protein CHK_0996 [Christensenella hongkongensis]|uniref:Uncharacterized protein n=1 Tax=Christensenella hongkongensis TaxID=270498 RepID=A0A0M2NG62_9FIRM|nr:hypothetical protein CHK_0996 [Christensenella hongkongensis]
MQNRMTEDGKFTKDLTFQSKTIMIIVVVYKNYITFIM